MLRVAGWPVKSRLTILYYHDVPDKYRFEFARQVDMLCRTAHVIPANFNGKLPSQKNCAAITFDDAFESVVRNGLPELARRSFHSTIFVPVGLIGQVPNWFADDASVTFEEPVMTAVRLKSLSSSLVALGSHSFNHLNLSQLDSERARYEIDDSRHRLAKLTDREVDLFAFPYGAYNERVIEICKSAGYKHVYTTELANVDTEVGYFVRGRVKVDPSDSQIEFFLKSNGAYRWIAFVRQIASRTFSERKQPALGPSTTGDLHGNELDSAKEGAGR
jgi:peptidoglycan/xylan/chitin deacetylase (PgdA/CDA1 family)